MRIEALRREFTPRPGYLAACTGGLPSRDTVAAMTADLSGWAGGSVDAADYARVAERARASYASLVGVSPERVALGSQVSALVAVVAASLPDGAEVLCVEREFASLSHPFERQAHRGVTVRYAPLAELPAAIRPGTTLVAYSMVQSACGSLAPHAEIVAAARAAGALTLADLTQSAGWLPANAAENDLTVCHAYKWLCSPRGAAFLTVSEALTETMNPTQAGWASGDDVWASCYAGHTPLAPRASRFDVSPAWQAWVGADAALRLFAESDIAEIQAHNLALANAFRARLGEPAGDSAIVTWSDPDGADLARMTAAGLVASGRAGNARVAFHLWNDAADVALLADALGLARPATP